MKLCCTIRTGNCISSEACAASSASNAQTRTWAKSRLRPGRGSPSAQYPSLSEEKSRAPSAQSAPPSAQQCGCHTDYTATSALHQRWPVPPRVNDGVPTLLPWDRRSPAQGRTVYWGAGNFQTPASRTRSTCSAVPCCVTEPQRRPPDRRSELAGALQGQVHAMLTCVDGTKKNKTRLS